jgi:MoaA/NifB/PqqE/SkfB family radical SAM enzyme
LSIGGLDGSTYKTMYGVDRFPQVRKGMERLLKLRDAVRDPAHITFAFRTNDRKFEARFKSQLAHYRGMGVHISHMWTFANFAGAVRDDKEKKLLVYDSRGEKRMTCVSPSMNITVCWDGNITACGCADFEGNGLRIGHAERESLAEVWTGKKRATVLASFGSGTLFPICRQCSGYTPDTFFARPCFKGIRLHQPLPLSFYRNVVT